MADDLTPQAMEGFLSIDPKSPYLSTSNSDSAWHIGRWLQKTGRPAPQDVRASRGCTFHVNGMKVKVSWWPGRTEVERIQ